MPRRGCQSRGAKRPAPERGAGRSDRANQGAESERLPGGGCQTGGLDPAAIKGLSFPPGRVPTVWRSRREPARTCAPWLYPCRPSPPARPGNVSPAPAARVSDPEAGRPAVSAWSILASSKTSRQTPEWSNRTKPAARARFTRSFQMSWRAAASMALRYATGCEGQAEASGAAGAAVSPRMVSKGGASERR